MLMSIVNVTFKDNVLKMRVCQDITQIYASETQGLINRYLKKSQ